MHYFFHKKIITPFLAVLLAAACITGTAAFFSVGCAGNRGQTAGSDERPLEKIYKDAVEDAIIAEEEELFPLVTITEDSKEVNWKDGKILLVTLNDTPEIYKEREMVVLPSEVWTFTDREIQGWYQDHHQGVTDWSLRLYQLIGVPPDAGYTHASAMWVSPEEVIRPAYRTDIQDGAMAVNMLEDMPDEYREWFDGNIIWSYFDSAYPWTRLGYTYDWAPESGEYGLTEFLIRPGAEVRIEYTDTISQFVERLENGIS